jgi:putative membrane protein
MVPDSPTAARDTLAAARTHLANERTFLAWIRTAVSMFALGLGIALFYDKTDGMQHIETLIAVGLSVTGIMTALLGYRRYRHVHDRVESGDDCSKVSRTVGLATIVAVAAGGLVLVFIATMALSEV